MNEPTMAQTSLSRLRSWMKEQDIDAAIVFHPANVAYLSDAWPPKERPVAAIVVAGASALVTPRPPLTLPDGMTAVGYEDYSIQYVVDLAANFARAFAAALAATASKARRLAVELAYLPAAQWEAVRSSLSPAHVQDVSTLLGSMRTIKSPAEIRAIERAVATTDAIFTAVAERIHAGSREVDVYVVGQNVVRQQDAFPADLDGDFVAGPRTEEIGGPPSLRPIKTGDLLIADVFPRIGTHCADCTRTYVAGQPTALQVERHAVLEEAMAVAERAITPGLPTRELYAILRAVLEKHGLARYFPHHAGHGVGLVPSEIPRLIPGSAEVLQEGMVITLEPGVYVPGQGGMRLEDNFLVTATGCRCLSRYPRRLTVI